MRQSTTRSASKLIEFYTAVNFSANEHSNVAKVSQRVQSSRFPSTAELKSSMARTPGLTEGSFGVLLPICLLAVFLSCVVCVYHWQSTRERRLDMEDERKRKRIHSELDGRRRVSRTSKASNKNKLQAYPWKTSTRIQDLPDLNNNLAFVIPAFPEIKYGSDCCYGNSSRPTGDVGHSSRHHKKPILKRPCIHKSGGITGDLSDFSFSSEAEFNLSPPSSWSADVSAEGFDVNEDRWFEGEKGTDVIYENQSYVIYSGEGNITCVETIHGSLLEYWV